MSKPFAFCGVYRVVNQVSGDCYVGSSVNVNKRWRSHVNYLKRGNHQSIKFQRAWDKYGIDAFLWEVIEVVADEAVLLGREQFYLDTLRPQYNMTLTVGTTFRHRKHSPETIAKMREAAVRRNQDPAYIEKLRQANAGRNNWTGKHLSDEHRAKISATHMGHQRNVGQCRSVESKAKISAAHQGKSCPWSKRENLSPERVAQLQQSVVANCQSEAAREKRRVSLLASWAKRKARQAAS